MKNFLILVFLFSIPVFSQSKDPYKILDKLKSKYDKINDYQVDVKIKLDIQNVKAPESVATIFFKKPDKMHVESEKFAMLPKEGINLSPATLLDFKYSAIYERDENIDGKNSSLIKVIPDDSENKPFSLISVWVDQHDNVIRKISTSSSGRGEMALYMRYHIKNEYGLPSEMEFKFDMSPKKTKTNAKEDEEEESAQSKRPTSGKVNIYYNNYKINKGISDKVFEKK